MKLKSAVINTIALTMLVTASAGFAADKDNGELITVQKFLSIPGASAILAHVFTPNFSSDKITNAIGLTIANGMTVSILASEFKNNPVSSADVALSCAVATAMWSIPTIYAALQSRGTSEIKPESDKDETGTDLKKFLSKTPTAGK